VTLSVQLSMAKHAANLVAKARSRIGYLFYKLPLQDVNLDLLLRVFLCYIMPIFTYCSSIWAHKLAQNPTDAINAVFTCYIKRYLGLPRSCSATGVHYYCNTAPLYHAIRDISASSFTNICFPPSMEGHQLSFANVPPLPPYEPESDLSEDFPREQVFISSVGYHRCKFFRHLFNINHFRICSVSTFHVNSTPECTCLYCHGSLAGPSSKDHSCPEIE